MQIYHVNGFLPAELSNPQKQNSDFAFQMYGGCAFTTGIFKTSYQINVSGQPCKNTLENIYTINLLCSLCLLFLAVFS